MQWLSIHANLQLVITSVIVNHGWGEQVKKKTARQKVREKTTKKESSEKVMRFYLL